MRIPANTTGAAKAASRQPTPGTSVGPDSTPVYFEYQVEEPVALLRWDQPVYPDSLKAGKVEGEVLIQFVVDTAGHVEPGSERVLRASRDAFRVAVVSTLGSARFTPALRKGQRVRQLVQQPFKFAPNAQVQPQAR